MKRWVVKTVPDGNQWLFDSKAAADPFCKDRIAEHPGTDLVLLFRKDMRPVTRYSSLNGQVVKEKLNRRTAAGVSSKRAARCDTEKIDIHLQNKLQLTAREAARAREALVEVWKEGLQAEGLVWTPAGVLLVKNARRVQRARNSSFKEIRKLGQRKVKIVFEQNPKLDETTAYTYKQYGIAKQTGLIEPRPERVSPLVKAMRPQSTKSKRTPPRRRRGIRRP